MSDDFFAKLNYVIRNSLSMAGIRVVIGAIRDSLEAGVFDRRTDRHITAVTYELDGQGWEEAKTVYRESMERLIHIGAAAEGRAVEKRRRGQGLRATFIQLAFESPPGSPRKHELGEVMKR